MQFCVWLPSLSRFEVSAMPWTSWCPIPHSFFTLRNIPPYGKSAVCLPIYRSTVFGWFFPLACVGRAAVSTVYGLVCSPSLSAGTSTPRSGVPGSCGSTVSQELPRFTFLLCLKCGENHCGQVHISLDPIPTEIRIFSPKQYLIQAPGGVGVWAVP